MVSARHSRTNVRINRRSVNGFSLLEVLVALVIIAIAIGTSLSAAQERTTTLEALRERIIARWVAHNTLAEIQKNPQDYETEQNGQSIQAGITFLWASAPDFENAAYKKLPITVVVKNAQGVRLSEAYAWISHQTESQESAPPLAQTSQAPSPTVPAL